MLRACRQLGDALDRSGVAGWLLLALGLGIVGATALLPPYLDLERTRAQEVVLHRRHRLLEVQHQNHRSFIRAVRNNDPLLMRRLAWHHLHVKPSGADPVGEWAVGSDDPAPPIRRWVAPDLPPIDPAVIDRSLPQTRLVRLLTGQTRPWVLAFGGWLILMGLMINPTPPSAEAVDEEDPEEEEPDEEEEAGAA